MHECTKHANRQRANAVTNPLSLSEFENYICTWRVATFCYLSKYSEKIVA